MSVIGISPSDLVKALQFCKWIYEHCYDQANTADVHYRQFLRDIRGLEQTLELLKKQVTFQQKNLDVYVDPFSNTSRAGAKQDFLEVVGDYESTLKECTTLLRTHKSIVRDGAGFITNVQWGTSIQGKVDSLQKRIQAHNGKIHLLLEPLRNDQLQGIETTLLGLYELFDPPPDLDISIIPDKISDKFAESLQDSLKSRSISFCNLTRREKLDTLYRVWQSSIFDKTDRKIRSVEQQLNLLKSAWLINKLKYDDSFKTARRGFPYRRTILELQRRVVQSCEEIKTDIYPTKEFLELDPIIFHVIQIKPQDITLPIPDERPFETKLLEIPLPEIQGCVSHTLVVFRSAAESLRILEEVTSNTRTKSREYQFDFRSDALLPYYAVPGEGTALTMVLRNRVGSRKVPYEMKRPRDLFDLQRAITGYEVLSDFVNVHWTTHKRWGHDMSSQGRIQIWRWRPLQSLEVEQALLARRRSSVSSQDGLKPQVASDLSQSTNSTWVNVIQGLHPSMLESSYVNLMDTQDGKNPVVATRTPHPPVIILFTQIEGGLAFVAFDYTRDIYKKTTACHCSSKARPCQRTVLYSRSGSLTIRKYSTNASSLSGAHLDRWDLSVFGCPSAEKPDFHQDYASRATQKSEVQYLLLDFPSDQDRAKFDRHTLATAQMRDEEEANLQAFYTHAATMQGNPKLAKAPTGALSVSNGSESTIRGPDESSLIDLAPKLELDVAQWRTESFD